MISDFLGRQPSVFDFFADIRDVRLSFSVRFPVLERARNALSTIWRAPTLAVSRGTGGYGEFGDLGSLHVVLEICPIHFACGLYTALSWFFIFVCCLNTIQVSSLALLVGVFMNLA